MLRFIVRIIGSMAGLYAATHFVPGFAVNGPWTHFLAAGILLALLNLIVRPVLKLISLPLIILTLGLFTIIINMLMLWLLGYLVSFVIIQSLLALLLATIVVSLTNWIFSIIIKYA